MSSDYDPTSLVVISVVLPLFSIVAVYLRFLVRIKIQPTYLGVDDWMILIALIFLLGDCSNLAVSAILGIQGRNYLDGNVPEDRQLVENKSDYAQVILEKPLYGLMKMSVLFFYRRIFTSHERFLKINAFMIALIGVWSLAYTIAEIFVCGGMPWVQWTPGVDATMYCVNRNDLNFTYAISDVIGDMIVVFMPFPVIRSLHMDRRQKIGVGIIFLLGALSTVSSILRLGFISVAFTQDYGAFGVRTTNKGTPPSAWSTIEAAVGVLAACLPPLGPLIRRTPHASNVSKRIYDRLMSGRSSSNHSRSPKNSSDNDNEHFVTPHGSTSQQMQAAQSWYSKHVDSRKGSYANGSRKGSAWRKFSIGSRKESVSTSPNESTIASRKGSVPMRQEMRQASISQPQQQLSVSRSDAIRNGSIPHDVESQGRF